MQQEAQCYKCRTELGCAAGLFTLSALLRACLATKDTLTFSVVCPKCGAQNNVKIKY